MQRKTTSLLILFLFSSFCYSKGSLDDILGEATKEAFALQYGFLENPVLQNWIKRIGEKLSKGAGVSVNFYILNTDRVNAYATFGKNVFLTKGLLKSVDSEDELAGVLAHEVAHIKLKHPQNQTNLVLLSLALLSSLNLSKKKEILAKSILGLINLGFSRKQEKRADIEGIWISLRSGFNPKGLLYFLQKLGDEKSPGWMEYLQTHPFPSHRIRICEEQLEKIKDEEWNRIYQSLMERGEVKEARELQKAPLPPEHREIPVVESEKLVSIHRKITSLHSLLNRITQWQTTLLISPIQYEIVPIVAESLLQNDELKEIYSDAVLLLNNVRGSYDLEEISDKMDMLIERAINGGEKLLLASATLSGIAFTKHFEDIALISLQSLLLSSGNDIGKAKEEFKNCKDTILPIEIDTLVQRLNLLDNEWLRRKCSHRLGISLDELPDKPLGEACLMKIIALSTDKPSSEIEYLWSDKGSFKNLLHSLKLKKPDVEAIYIVLNSLVKGN
ncbi:M48 family metalloprotease [bacterium]|nr:M48 family metalloprotease [bacterium]